MAKIMLKNVNDDGVYLKGNNKNFVHTLTRRPIWV